MESSLQEQDGGGPMTGQAAERAAPPMASGRMQSHMQYRSPATAYFPNAPSLGPSSTL